jgi:hypothetical protein
VGLRLGGEAPVRLRLMLVIGIVVALVTAALGSKPATSAGRACRWNVYGIPAYRDATHHPGISNLAAASARTVWAAGWWTDPLVGLEHPVTFRWNGRSWRLVPSPNFGVIAAFRRAAWLVGRRHGRTWTARWNGRRWQAVPSPGGRSSYLVSVTMVSPRDVWTVGSSRTGPLLLRWNGKRWAQAAGPDFGGSAGSYYAVARVPGTSSVWIFGSDPDSSAQLAARWTGSGWETYSLPTSGTGSAIAAMSLAADSASSAWIGMSVQDTSGKMRPWMLHWDGSSWSQVPAPNPGGNGEISSVSAGTSSDAWAIGSYIVSRKKAYPFALHWDRVRWSTVALPRRAKFSEAVAAVPGTHQAWFGGGTLDRYNC